MLDGAYIIGRDYTGGPLGSNPYCTWCEYDILPWQACGTNKWYNVLWMVIGGPPLHIILRAEWRCQDPTGYLAAWYEFYPSTTDCSEIDEYTPAPLPGGWFSDFPNSHCKCDFSSLSCRLQAL